MSGAPECGENPEPAGDACVHPDRAILGSRAPPAGRQPEFALSSDLPGRSGGFLGRLGRGPAVALPMLALVIGVTFTGVVSASLPVWYLQAPIGDLGASLGIGLLLYACLAAAPAGHWTLFGRDRR